MIIPNDIHEKWKQVNDLMAEIGEWVNEDSKNEIIIPANSDMNTYVIPGRYRWTDEGFETASTLLNMPMPDIDNFTLNIYLIAPNALMQEIIEDCGAKFIRIAYLTTSDNSAQWLFENWSSVL